VPVGYKIDVLAALKEKGYTTYKLRKEKLLGESVLTQLRAGEPVSWANVARICELLGCQVGDLLEYRAEE
jgi:putative transcriptional regulator